MAQVQNSIFELGNFIRPRNNAPATLPAANLPAIVQQPDETPVSENALTLRSQLGALQSDLLAQEQRMRSAASADKSSAAQEIGGIKARIASLIDFAREQQPQGLLLDITV